MSCDIRVIEALPDAWYVEVLADEELDWHAIGSGSTSGEAKDVAETTLREWLARVSHAPTWPRGLSR